MPVPRALEGGKSFDFLRRDLRRTGLAGGGAPLNGPHMVHSDAALARGPSAAAASPRRPQNDPLLGASADSPCCMQGSTGGLHSRVMKMKAPLVVCLSRPRLRMWHRNASGRIGRGARRRPL